MEKGKRGRKRGISELKLTAEQGGLAVSPPKELTTQQWVLGTSLGSLDEFVWGIVSCSFPENCAVGPL